jgi:hypothetical protein
MDHAAIDFHHDPQGLREFMAEHERRSAYLEWQVQQEMARQRQSSAGKVSVLRLFGIQKSNCTGVDEGSMEQLRAIFGYVAHGMCAIHAIQHIRARGLRAIRDIRANLRDERSPPMAICWLRFFLHRLTDQELTLELHRVGMQGISTDELEWLLRKYDLFDGTALFFFEPAGTSI